MDRLRIAPVAGSALPGDEPVIVDPASPGAAVVEPFGSGRWAVHRSDGPDRWAETEPARRRPDGATIVAVVVDGWRFELEVERADRAELRRRATRTPDAVAASGPAEIRAIIPGRIAAVRVVAGDAVEAGQSLLVIEAMKMQNELRAPRAGTIERVVVGQGDTIDAGDLLVVVR
jgi:biotin carboxyl carrier protein